LYFNNLSPYGSAADAWPRQCNGSDAARPPARLTEFAVQDPNGYLLSFGQRTRT
jgi:hypothetical protein